MGYLTINTQSNRVVIISSIITWIFLNSVHSQDGHISTYLSKRHSWFIYVVYSAHVLVILCSIYYCCSIILFIVWLRSSFCSTFVFIRSSAFHCSLFRCSKKKDSILTLDCIPGILILLYHHHLCKSINIILQTKYTFMLLF